MIEMELIWETVPNEMADLSGQSSPADPSDLEPYLDFLDEIEAFDGLKERAVHYGRQFEL